MTAQRLHDIIEKDLKKVSEQIKDLAYKDYRTVFDYLQKGFLHLQQKFEWKNCPNSDVPQLSPDAAAEKQKQDAIKCFEKADELAMGTFNYTKNISTMHRLDMINVQLFCVWLIHAENNTLILSLIHFILTKMLSDKKIVLAFHAVTSQSMWSKFARKQEHAKIAVATRDIVQATYRNLINAGLETKPFDQFLRDISASEEATSFISDTFGGIQDKFLIKTFHSPSILLHNNDVILRNLQVYGRTRGVLHFFQYETGKKLPTNMNGDMTVGGLHNKPVSDGEAVANLDKSDFHLNWDGGSTIEHFSREKYESNIIFGTSVPKAFWIFKARMFDDEKCLKYVLGYRLSFQEGYTGRVSEPITPSESLKNIPKSGASIVKVSAMYFDAYNSVFALCILSYDDYTDYNDLIVLKIQCEDNKITGFNQLSNRVHCEAATFTPSGDVIIGYRTTDGNNMIALCTFDSENLTIRTPSWDTNTPTNMAYVSDVACSGTTIYLAGGKRETTQL